ncbi:bifunctional glutamate N-acetyltransferase/amino-acid acetyltransferase ArgJ [Veillonella criceti]|uniref:Arginine biosynthesis bifunctional protein ArgJ n=1 Tax=Veillonella criceti TaxID=103891 RepID=A0A380NMQ4_9FIRM|nr:bifunctional glutamate N-acetyltransferase/amino-acid acetyltransferase ArgJ [Veillonella criceti]SUP43679.1 Arginine biosynthesis bifunctional protein ArgJ [Veillonella criceti]
MKQTITLDTMSHGVTYAKGFQAIGIQAGLKKSGKHDLALIYTDKKAAVAGTFTQNKVAAAPVYVSKETVATGTAHAIISNSGCANACTGAQGLADAHTMAKATAEALHCSPNDIIVGSTGIIGQQLPINDITKAIPTLVNSLSFEGTELAGKAILTTDTYSKTASTHFTIDGKDIHMGAIAKGSGMIRPNMATMLCYITTDIAITPTLLQKALHACVNKSFNMISVDGDMSTNDMAIVLANGAAENTLIDTENSDFYLFQEALMAITVSLAKQIAADGEGASKFITINVEGATDFENAKLVGMTIANSPLVKTAFFGEDPNWGRLICAAGYAGAPMNPDTTVLKIGGIIIFKNGMGAVYNEKKLQDIMSAHDITVTVELDEGEAQATVWTCDLTYDYVKINGEYHT